MRTVLALAILGLLAGAAQASVLEPRVLSACALVFGADAEHLCSLQYDGGHHGDASDVCRAPEPALPFGQRTTGLVVPVEDERDHYALFVPASLVGARLTLVLEPAPLVKVDGLAGTALVLPAPNHDVFVWSPQCQAILAAGTNLGTRTEQVSFVPRFSGVHTVQVLLGPASVSVDVDGGVLEPQTQGCHDVCFGEMVNPALGYGLYLG